MSFVLLVAVGAIVFTLINFLKDITNRLWSPVLTQILAWAFGVVVVVVLAQTKWADTVSFGGLALSKIDGSSLFVIGIMVASIFGVIKEIIKAVDGSDSAAKPPLFPVHGSRPNP